MLDSVSSFEVHEARTSPFHILTPREQEVLPYLTSGVPNKVIAIELGVSQRTVEAHRARIFEKMQVRNAVELTHRYLYWRLAVRNEEQELSQTSIDQAMG
ncbi:MAG TPA: LuxR C-terminal-related transcriptional regulator [Castellaniella sp.]|nr:LuxR C-terminal-related transcriptional regulator [Castellaniella sp.]